MRREQCPCCGYPTLQNRGDYEICLLCDWEDDNQNDLQAAEVLGGPNGDYSLKEARENFKDHFDMYRKAGKVVSKTEIEMKKRLMSAYEGMKNKADAEENWDEILKLEQELH